MARTVQSKITWLVALLLFSLRTAGAAAPPCRDITGFDTSLSNARGLFVADMHGTVQAPAFVGALVCHLTHAGRGVLLGLELPASEQALLDEFVQSGSADARRNLLAGPFWSRPSQDGRSSQAMLGLLESIHDEIRRGARVTVIALDARPDTGLTGTAAFNARDAAMADTLRQHLAAAGKGAFPVIFAGNVHARKTRGLQFENAPPGMEDSAPMGYLLRDLRLRHLNIDFSGGSLWTCMAPTGCAVHEIGDPGPAIETFTIGPSANPAYDLQYSVGSLTASAPASQGR